MKKLLSIIAALAVAVVPNASVLALSDSNCSETASCYVYPAGSVDNFMTGKGEVDRYNAGDLTVGQHVVVLSDEGKDSQYVKALAIAIADSGVNAAGGVAPAYYDGTLEPGQNLKDKIMSGDINLTGEGSWEYAKHENGKLVLEFITLDELKSVFGATYDGSNDTYKIDMNKVPALMKEEIEDANEIASKIEETDPSFANWTKNGFFTGTYDKAQNFVWVVKFHWNGTALSGMTVEKENLNAKEYAVMTAAYFDKRYDCKEHETQENYACYSCGEEYIWTEVGKQAETCEIVESIKVKSKCVKNAKTGVKEYILEFAGISAICGVALVLAKRKDLFKSI